jgi:hypothetical protein
MVIEAPFHACFPEGKKSKGTWQILTTFLVKQTNPSDRI